MITWTKYTFVCDPDNCDALLEFTARDGFDFPNGVVQITCPCGRQMQYISATIQPPTNERNKMETTPVKEDLINMWRQELELTYGNEITELKNQLSALQNKYDYVYSQSSSDKNKFYTKENQLRTYLIENYEDLADHAEYIAEIFDIQLSRDVTYSVQMTATVTVSVPLGEDGEDILRDSLYIDANHGDVVIDDYDVEEINEEY